MSLADLKLIHHSTSIRLKLACLFMFTFFSWKFYGVFLHEILFPLKTAPTPCFVFPLKVQDESGILLFPRHTCHKSSALLLKYPQKMEHSKLLDPMSTTTLPTLGFEMKIYKNKHFFYTYFLYLF